MHRTPSKARPDADRLQGGFASLGMPGQMREPARTGDVEPVSLARHPQARFIPVQHAAHRKPLRNPRDRRLQAGRGYLHPTDERRFGHVRVVEVREHFTGPAQWD